MQRTGFGDLETDITASAQWQGILKQLQSEGQTQTDIDIARKLFGDSFTQMVGDNLHIDAGTAFDSAKQLVYTARTVAGAVDSIQGLVQAAEAGAPPTAIVSQFTGVLVAFAVTAGAVSAGVGALIVAGIGIVLKGLEALGLFADPAPGTDICGTTWRPPPDWVVGCWGVYGTRPTPGQVPSPGRANWRTFPDPSKGNAPWASFNGITMTNADWFDPNYMNPSVGVKLTPIQRAFPQYTRLSFDVSVFPPGIPSWIGTPGASVRNWPPAVFDFYKAFYAAWKANCEYALSGLKAAPDWQVLLNVLRTWNLAHDPGTPFTFEARDSDINDYLPMPSNPMPYVSILVKEIGLYGSLDLKGGVTQVSPIGIIQVNTGARKNPARVTSAGPLPPSSTTSVATGIVYVAGAGLLGAAIYSFIAKKSFSAVVGGAWRKTTGSVKKALHLKSRR